MGTRNKIKRHVIKSIAVAAIGGWVASANALILDFYHGDTVWATMTTSNATDFTLDFSNVAYPTSFIDYINLAGPGGTFSDHSVDTDATGTFSSGGFTDAGETYNWRIQFPNPNNSSRFTPGEQALWSIVVTDPDVWDFNLVHINAMDAQGKSIKLSSCVRGDEDCGDLDEFQVPAPGPLSLLGLGLLAIGLFRRTAG